MGRALGPFRPDNPCPSLPLPPPLLTPSTNEEIVEAVHSADRLLPVGAQTKSRLCQTDSDTQLLDLRKHTGITEYHPSEYTFTAKAGTTLREINETLRAKGQYLPFDPPFSADGATLGGTVAANLSGPGRFRFGGVRDFILGLSFVDGNARLIRGGGKVVKNAAGFDSPKFMVGSLGRFGVITELTFKVFPRPPSTLTVALQFSEPAAALAKLVELSRSRYELDALDYQPRSKTLWLRLAGPAESNAALANHLGGNIVPCESVWPDLNTFAWAPPAHTLVKVPTGPRQALDLLTNLASLSATSTHLSAGANTLWIATVDLPSLESILITHQAPAQVIRGASPHIHLAPPPSAKITQSLKDAFDPRNRFAPLI